MKFIEIINRHHIHHRPQTLDICLLDILQNRLWKKHKHGLLYRYFDSCWLVMLIIVLIVWLFWISVSFPRANNMLSVYINTKLKFYYHRSGFRTCQTCKMACFTKIVNDWKTLIGFPKRSVLDVWRSSENASIISNIIVINWLIIYLSLLLPCRRPKCPSHEGKLVPRTIQFGIYDSPPCIHMHKVQMLAEHVGTPVCRNTSIVLHQT